jgi:hypothetical protein
MPTTPTTENLPGDYTIRMDGTFGRLACPTKSRCSSGCTSKTDSVQGPTSMLNMSWMMEIANGAQTRWKTDITPSSNAYVHCPLS